VTLNGKILKPSIIKSIDNDQTEIIRNILKLHVPNKLIDCDCTYSQGYFYKNGKVPQPKLKFDINPQTKDTIKADSRRLPLLDNSLSCIMFDPPFLISKGPSLKKIVKGSTVISTRFSSFESTQELYSYYFHSLKEFNRILKDNGIVIFKCQDTVSSGKNYLSHYFILNMAIGIGFYPKDLFILVASSRIIGNINHQIHARKFHSYFLVLEKSNKFISIYNILIR